jgi:hypothetical protein
VTNGLFTVLLDIGTDPFNGQARWLDIAVNNTVPPTPLTPRQPLTATPYAMYSLAPWARWADISYSGGRQT